LGFSAAIRSGAVSRVGGGAASAGFVSGSGGLRAGCKRPAASVDALVAIPDSIGGDPEEGRLETISHAPDASITIPAMVMARILPESRRGAAFGFTTGAGRGRSSSGVPA